MVEQFKFSNRTIYTAKCNKWKRIFKMLSDPFVDAVKKAEKDFLQDNLFNN